jgi:hypothetical protein
MKKPETLQCIIESLEHLDDNERELVHEVLEDPIKLWTKELGDINVKGAGEPRHDPNRIPRALGVNVEKSPTLQLDASCYCSAPDSILLRNILSY